MGYLQKLRPGVGCMYPKREYEELSRQLDLGLILHSATDL